MTRQYEYGTMHQHFSELYRQCLLVDSIAYYKVLLVEFTTFAKCYVMCYGNHLLWQVFVMSELPVHQYLVLVVLVDDSFEESTCSFHCNGNELSYCRD